LHLAPGASQAQRGNKAGADIAVHAIVTIVVVAGPRVTDA
jgi:hypothetical protein